MDLYPDSSRAAADPAPPTLFSMSRGVLENKRINISSQDSQAAARSSDVTPRRFLPSAPPARISVNALIPPTHPARTTTPVVTRIRTTFPNQNERPQDTENEFSSPSVTSPPVRAYMHPTRQRNSASPTVDRTFRLSELSRPVATPQQQKSASTKESSSVGDAPHLLASLSASVATNTQLHNEKTELNTTIYKLTCDLTATRSKLATSTTRLEQAEDELKTTRPVVASIREQLASREMELSGLKEVHQETKEALEKSVNEAADVREAHTKERVENERLRTSVDTAKNSIAKLFVELRTQGENRRELKKLYDGLNVRYIDLSKEADQLRTMAKNGLAALEPMLDDDSTLTRAAETKALLQELQAEVRASHEVTDLLRNKLQVQGCQVAEHLGRIRDLEDEKRGVMQKMLEAQQDEKDHRKSLEAVHAQYEELSQRLAHREAETVDVLATAAANEEKLKVARAEIDMHQKNLEAQRSELESLRVMKEEHVSRLLALQQTINARDKDIVSLKEHVKAAQESKADLRALLAEAKSTLAEKEVTLASFQERISAQDKELATLKEHVKAAQDSKEDLRVLLAEAKKALGEALEEKESALRAKDPNDEYLIRIADLERDTVTLKAALEDSQEERILTERGAKKQQAETQKDIARLTTANTELSTQNKLLQELLGKAEEKLTDLGNAEAQNRLLQESLAKAEHDLEALTATSTSVQAQLNKRLETQSISLFQAKEEVSTLKERVVALSELKAQNKSLEGRLKEQVEVVVRLKDERSTLQARVSVAQEHQRKDELHIKANEKRALAAEKALGLADKQLQDANTVIASVNEENRNLQDTVASLRDTVSEFENTRAHDADERVVQLEERVAALSREKAQLVNNADQLLNRFKDGKLTAKEKEVIRHIMEDASRIHVEENVKRDHEMRRREQSIQSLTEKNAELQASVARLLKEKATGDAQKSLVNPKAWLSSSPRQPSRDGEEGSMEQDEMPKRANPVESPPEHTKPHTGDGDYASDLTDFEDDNDKVNPKPADGPSTTKNKRARSPSDAPPDIDHKQTKKRNNRAATMTAQPQASSSTTLRSKTTITTNVSKAKPKKRK